jgi:hypothetical protein
MMKHFFRLEISPMQLVHVNSTYFGRKSNSECLRCMSTSEEEVRSE